MLLWVQRVVTVVTTRAPWILLLTLMAIFFNKMACINLILARGDTFLYFYPYWAAAAEALQNGRIPYWNSHLFMGAPLLANSQVGFFYPLNWPLWLTLSIPYAVKATILLHLFIAGWGAYIAGRRCLSLGRSGSLVTAVLFSLGGYLTSQVEHVNQLQGLAWLPWFFVVVHGVAASKGNKMKAGARGVALMSLLFALQLLAGHTQTTFITGIALVVWSGSQFLLAYLSRNTAHELRFSFYTQRYRQVVLPALVGGGLLALLLAAVQLLPTWELTQLSSRQGGLSVNEVLSFSLHPLLLTQALLPGYGRLLFSEYVAFLPVTALILAVIGGWQWRQWRGVLPAIALMGVGLFLALGAFNPLYWLLARLPGFDLFRVPARWLILYSFGLSLLAGLGWQVVWDRWLMHHKAWEELPERAQQGLWHVERPLQVGLIVVLLLVVWSIIANILAIFIPTGPESPYENPAILTVLLWLIEALVVYRWLSEQRLRLERGRGRRLPLMMERQPPQAPWLLAAIMLVTLFWTSRAQPYNNLTTPEALFDLRPSVTRLQAEGLGDTLPAGRFLSLSATFFDPGDQAEIDSIYGDQLPAAALYDYTVAIKQKEIVAPNLPMVYGLTSVDGFDGGILPTNSYSQLMRLVLPEGRVTTDGRLREQLTTIPEAKWLDLFNAQYLITDKVGDVWHEGVFFDLQHQVTLAVEKTAVVGDIPDFLADAVWFVADGDAFTVNVQRVDGEQWQLTPTLVTEGVYTAVLPQAAQLAAIEVVHDGGETAVVMNGVSLVNREEETFQSVVLGQYGLIHSGDVKIYENLDVLPRAFLVDNWAWYPPGEESLMAMAAEGFAVGETAVVQGAAGATRETIFSCEPPLESCAESAQVSVISHEPEQVIIEVVTEHDGLLVLTDSFYPGWQATINGEPVAIEQVDILFRGVFVPSGVHEVRFAFEGDENGRLVTLFGLFLWLTLFVFGHISPLMKRKRS